MKRVETRMFIHANEAFGKFHLKCDYKVVSEGLTSKKNENKAKKIKLRKTYQI